MVDTTNMITVEDLPTRLRADAEMFVEMAEAAARFIRRHPACISIKKSYLDRGLAGVLAVFYFELESRDPDTLPAAWVLCGALPMMFAPSAVAVDGMDAIARYLEALDVWCWAVRLHESAEEFPPVFNLEGTALLEPTDEHADYIEPHTKSMREMIVPWLEDWTPDQE